MLSACGGGGGGSGDADPPPPPPSPPPSQERSLAPVSADTQADSSSAPHFVINPSASVTAKVKLFVFLPGTGGVPSQYKSIVRAGASRGFHAIGLDYMNPQPVGVICATSADVDCFWNVRREVITGQSLSTEIAVDGPNSIVTRLAKAIGYLANTAPTEGWGAYLKPDGTVDWSKVVVGGHSQGGGHAGVMTKLYAMSRACYFASPPDWSGGPASWMSRPNVTPASAQFGVVHVNDPLVPLTKLSAIWPTLGLAGPQTSVDGSSAPYGNSHQLTTLATPLNTPGAVSPLHGVTVIDESTPVQGNGTPTFDPVWGYLCFS